MRSAIQEIIQNPKTAQVAAGATIPTGFTTAIGVFPSILGSIASIVGITVTIILYKKQKRKMDLEIKVLEMKKGEK